MVGSRILEIGCGPGWLLLDLLAAGYDAYGLDLSPEFWRQTGRRLRQQGHPNRLVGGDARALPFSAESFDTLVLTFPAPFVRDPWFWREADRVLRRHSGKLVIIEAAIAERSLWPRALGKVIGRVTGPVPNEESRFTIGSFVAERRVVQTEKERVWLVTAVKRG